MIISILDSDASQVTRQGRLMAAAKVQTDGSMGTRCFHTQDPKAVKEHRPCERIIRF